MNKPLCSLEAVSFAYPKGQAVLQNINLKVYPGKCLTILGGSGSGKSTLGQILAGFLSPTSGTLSWQEGFLSTLDTLEKYRKRQMVFQDPSSALTSFYTPYKTLYEVLKLHTRLSHEELQQEALKTLTEFGLGAEVIYKKISSLSGGEKQRIVLARALCLNPKLLILDEPLSSCDVSLQASILLRLKELVQKKQLTVVIILHDIQHAAFLADDLCILHQGRIEEYGEAAQILTSPQSAYAQKLLGAFV